MLTENQTIFLEALRSGELEQTQGSLKTDEGYCCLGVASECYIRATNKAEWVFWTTTSSVKDFNRDTRKYSFKSKEEGGTQRETAYIPHEVATWLGIGGQALTFKLDVPGETYSNPIALNDSRKWNFSQIADEFEKYFEKVNREAAPGE